MSNDSVSQENEDSCCLFCHLETCELNPKNEVTSKVRTGFQMADDSEEEESGEDSEGETVGENFESKEMMCGHSFNPEADGLAVTEWIILDGLPVSYVESSSFEWFVSHLMPPTFTAPSISTVINICYGIFADHKSKLKSFFSESEIAVNLTVDIWKSVHGIDFMCLTAHYIDNDWKLQKKILTCFVPLETSEEVGEKIEECLIDYGIKRVFVVTFQDPNTFDGVISYLRKRLDLWNANVLGGRFLPIWCMVHHVKSIVIEVFKENCKSIDRIRGAVCYLRAFGGIKQFKKFVRSENMKYKMLTRDITPQWNFTYLMLETAEKFEKAFERYAQQDEIFRNHLDDGAPGEFDWLRVRRLNKFLSHFNDLTLNLSGLDRVTSDNFLSEIFDMHFVLKNLKEDEDIEISKMATEINSMYSKYWENPEKVNPIVFIAPILDPRTKIDFVEFVILQIFGEDKGKNVFNTVKDTTYDLFDWYQKMSNHRFPSSASEKLSSLAEKPKKRAIITLFEKYQKLKAESGVGCSKSELEKYLEKDHVVDDPDLDVLNWWRLHSSRYPILALMARDILSVPISAVASDFAFRTEDYVLEEFRFPLNHKLLQAKVCARDWLTTPRARMPEEDEESEESEEEEE